MGRYAKWILACKGINIPHVWHLSYTGVGSHFWRSYIYSTRGYTNCFCRSAILRTFLTIGFSSSRLLENRPLA
jgi:hypothetical protein